MTRSQPRIPHPASRSPHPASRTPHPASRSPLPASRSPLPAPRIPLPAPRTPRPASRSPLPAPRFPHPASRFPHPALLLLLPALLAGVARGERPRFEARFADGSRVEGSKLSGWSRDGRPLLDERPLFDEPPLLWLRDRHVAPPAPAGPHFELANGDRLPGELLEFVAEGQDGLSRPAHFVVRPACLLEAPPNNLPLPVRILADWTSRIVVVAPRTVLPHTPNTLFLRDGREIAARSLRFTTEHVGALTESGRQEFSWGELAEVHLPVRPSTDWVLDEWAQLSPGGQRLLAMESDDGLRVTASLERMEHRLLGQPDELERWVHGLHPAWSLDILWMPARRVWLRTSWAPTQLPLSRLLPAEYRHQPLLGVPRPWRRDRSVAGVPLHSGGREHGWGWGVPATSELLVDLPAAARSVRGGVGVDSGALGGGCVRASIGIVDGPELFRSEPLVGTAGPVEFGPLALPDPGASPQRLRLTIDAAHADRPAGADPFDIRDEADWLDPLLELDPEQLTRDLAERAGRVFAPWSGWSERLDGEVRWTNQVDDLAPPPGAFLRRVATSGELRLRRTLRPRPEQRFLVVGLSHDSDQQQPVVEVIIDGRLAGQVKAPRRDRTHPEAPPIVVPLAPVPSGATPPPVDVELVVRDSQGASLRWDFLSLAAQHPAIYRVFDDEPLAASAVDPLAFVGPRTLQLSRDQRVRIEFARPVRLRYRPDWNEFRHLRFAIRKTQGGRVGLAIHRVGEATPQYFDLGHGPPVHPEARRIWTNPLLDEWQLVVRDICGDLNQSDIEALEFFSPDDGKLSLDQIYLGRGNSDFEGLPPALTGPWNDPQQRARLVGELRERGRPLTVTLTHPDGRVSEGIVLGSQGEVLTVGHALGPVDSTLQVALPDGRTISGVARGVCRDRDWGLVHCDELQEAPTPPLLEAPHPPFNAPFVEVGAGGVGSHDLRAEAELLQELRVAGAPAGAPTGRPLWDAAGRVVGLRVAGAASQGDSPPRVPQIDAANGDEPSPSQTWYGTLTEFSGQRERLRNGDRWGRWRIGRGVDLGLTIHGSERGAVVDAVAQPGRAGDVRPGDVIIGANGYPVSDHWSLHLAIGELDPEAEVSIEYLRDDQPRTTTIRLGFRVD